MICLDSINRGLLSGLQVPITHNESAFAGEEAFFEYYSKLVPGVVIPGLSTVLINHNVPGTVSFHVYGKTYILSKGERVNILPPQTSVEVTHGGIHLGLPPMRGMQPQSTSSGLLYLKSEREDDLATYTVGLFEIL